MVVVRPHVKVGRPGMGQAIVYIEYQGNRHWAAPRLLGQELALSMLGVLVHNVVRLGMKALSP